MIKIAFIINFIYNPNGGTEKQLLMLLDGIDKKIFCPYLIYLQDTEYLNNTNFNFPIIKIPIKKITSFDFFKGILKFIMLHRKEKFDIIQTLFPDGNIFGVVAAHFAGCRKIIASRRNIGYWYNNKTIYVLRFLRYWTHCYLANSKAAAEVTASVERVPHDRIFVIPNGIEIDNFRKNSPHLALQQRTEWGLNSTHTVIGVVANMRPVKNVESLVQAAITLMPEFPNLRFVWVGWSNEHDKYVKLVKSKGLAEYFLFPGPTCDIVRCLAAFNIAALCSFSESLSNSLLEYMAAGLPIVASNVGGNKEVIIHERTGLLFSPYDSNELTSFLRKLLKNPLYAAKLGLEAQYAANSFYSKENMINEYELFYKKILNISQ